MKKLEKQIKDFKQVIEETPLLNDVIKTRLIARLDEAERNLDRRPKK